MYDGSHWHITFGNAVGNAIVGAMQSSEAEQPAEQQNQDGGSGIYVEEGTGDHIRFADANDFAAGEYDLSALEFGTGSGGFLGDGMMLAAADPESMIDIGTAEASVGPVEGSFLGGVSEGFADEFNSDLVELRTALNSSEPIISLEGLGDGLLGLGSFMLDGITEAIPGTGITEFGQSARLRNEMRGDGMRAALARGWGNFTDNISMGADLLMAGDDYGAGGLLGEMLYTPAKLVGEALLGTKGLRYLVNEIRFAEHSITPSVWEGGIAEKGLLLENASESLLRSNGVDTFFDAKHGGNNGFDGAYVVYDDAGNPQLHVLEAKSADGLIPLNGSGSLTTFGSNSMRTFNRAEAALIRSINKAADAGSISDQLRRQLLAQIRTDNVSVDLALGPATRLRAENLSQITQNTGWRIGNTYRLDPYKPAFKPVTVPTVYGFGAAYGANGGG